MSRIARFSLALAVLVSGGLTIAARLADTGTPQAKTKGPTITTEEETFPFGSIRQGQVVEHTFIIRNTGEDTLVINNTQSSCGCTTSMVDINHIPPGGVGKLKAVFNSAGKIGHITKTIYIYSNDVNNPNKTVQITADIMTEPPSVHGGMMKGEVHLEGVFEGDCATCHVDKGRGLLGKELYAADCALCHGNPADGKPGADLNSPAMAQHDATALSKIITDGIVKSMMPAYGKAHAGPLDAKEIQSLVDYIVQATHTSSQANPAH